MPPTARLAPDCASRPPDAPARTISVVRLSRNERRADGQPAAMGGAYAKQNRRRQAPMGVEGMFVLEARQEELDAAYQRHFADLVRLCRALGAGHDSEDLAQ